MTGPTKATGPLRGVRVVEFAGIGPGPFAAMLLSDMGADVVTTEKVDRISRALDEHKRAFDQLTLKKARPALSRDGGFQAMPSEHKQAFEAYVRSGDDRLIRSLDTKAMSYGSGQDGGYLVPDETEAAIGRRLRFSLDLIARPVPVGGPTARFGSSDDVPQDGILQAASACSFWMPSPSAMRTKPVTLTGAPISLPAFSTTCFTRLSPSMT